MGEPITPKTDFDFDVLEKGVYRLKVKEAKIEAQKEGKESGKRYWVRLVAVGGSQDGVSHLESFYEKTKDNFSLSKLAGFLTKLGVLKPGSPIDTDLFKKPEFEKKWIEGLIGREMGGKIGHKTKGKDGKELDTPQSDLKAYYTLEEYFAIVKKQGGGEAVPASSATITPEVPAGPSVWD